MKLLLFDDDTSCTEVMSHFFAAHGYELEVASELEQAETLLSIGSFDAVITDLAVPDFTRTGGLRLLEFIRDRGIETRVIILTANEAPDIREKALRLGAEQYIVKPVSLERVAEFLRDGVPHAV